jgi:hypothetical protein
MRTVIRFPVAFRPSHVWTFCALIALGSVRTVAAQQTPPRADTIPPRPDYKDLQELLANLPNIAAPEFGEQRALWLGSLPLACIDRLHARPGRAGGAGRAAAPPAADTTRGRGGAAPDSAGRRAGPPGGRATVSAAEYFWVATYRLIPEHNRRRAFWGCTDWRSSVSSTWVIARLLREFPASGLHELSLEKLNDHLGKTNLEGELAFFRTAAGTFERPHGYAWLLKLQSELRSWPDSTAKRWANNVAPLAAWMADSLIAHMNALRQPVRTGSQTNTAFILMLASDYAEVSGHLRLRTAITTAARRFYLADKQCNTLAEAGAAGAARGRGAGRGATPGAAAADSAGRGAGAGRGPVPPQLTAGAADILSPCLAEAALMARVLTPAAFVTWLDAFLPPLQSGRFAPLTEAPGANATGAERVRLSALAFQRAYALERIARVLPATDARVIVLRRLSAIHAERGFQLMRDDTMGTHWLPAYALLYLTSRN